MKTHNATTVARTLVASLALAAGSALASKDYYVHTEPYNPSGWLQQQPWSITVDWPNGNTLTPPNDACGVRFEGDSELKWYSDNYDLEEEYPIPSGIANVWLPHSDCSAWNGVTVNPVGESQLHSPPPDFAGYILADATLYWINANGEKLISVNPPCLSEPECTSTVANLQGFVSNGWSDQLGYPFYQIKRSVDLLDSLTMEAMVQIELATAATAEAAARLEQHLVQRRRYHTGTLERPIRQLEDAARRSVAAAQRALADCSAAFDIGDSDTAYRACNTALLNMQAARSALDTGDAWVE